MTASIPPSALPMSDASAVAAPASPVVPRAASQSATPQQADAVPKVDTVELSDRALAAQAMMQGANNAAAGQGSPEVDRLAQQVASGSYLPPSHDVAAALMAFERSAGVGTT